ncbi:MAG: GWxTD domain-containing protein [Bacteroidales bacterium]|nr:GWxTD domain-containing protein [Bacteroidales bacterium]
MKKIFVLFLFSVAATAFAQERQLSALFTHSKFNIPGDTPYVETYLLFDAWNLEFVPTNGKYQAAVEITLVARQGDSIYFAKKYTLNSPAIAKATDDQFQFLDMQRFSLKNGVYVLEITAKDKNTSAKPQTITDTVSIAFPLSSPSMSSILPISKATPTQNENMLSRNGYDMVPYTNSFLPESIKELNYYFEIYNISNGLSQLAKDNADAATENTLRNDIIATHCYLETLETGRKVEGTERYHRHNPENMVAEYGTIDISHLPSGNYNLVAEVVNRNNDLLLFSKYPFQRSNPTIAATADLSHENIAYIDSNFATQITDKNKLTYYINGLWPVANNEERRYINNCKNLSIEENQHFLFVFWARRNNLDPESEWTKYLQQLKFVEEKYGYGKTPGYATDRGRVYLQYGPPNYIIDGHHKVSVRNHQTQGQVFYYPYEMWRYDMLPADEPKRMFVFFDEFQSGDFKLLHSNARGEVQDMLWERRLSRNMLEEYVQGEAGMQFEKGY